MKRGGKPHPERRLGDAAIAAALLSARVDPSAPKPSVEAKAARIFLGAAAGAAPRFLAPAQVSRIAGRPDEHHRRKVLGL